MAQRRPRSCNWCATNWPRHHDNRREESGHPKKHCQKDHLLAFSCKGRWFCPSCHQKKVQLFGALLTESILFPVPHRHVTLTIPKMLRPYFRYHRDLLKDLCRIAHECVRDVMRISLDQPEGMPGIVMAIHIPRLRDEYLDFHPHLHLLMADGLFLRDERFLVFNEFKPENRFVGFLHNDRQLRDKFGLGTSSAGSSGFRGDRTG